MCVWAFESYGVDLHISCQYCNIENKKCLTFIRYFLAQRASGLPLDDKMGKENSIKIPVIFMCKIHSACWQYVNATLLNIARIECVCVCRILLRANLAYDCLQL